MSFQPATVVRRVIQNYDPNAWWLHHHSKSRVTSIWGTATIHLNPEYQLEAKELQERIRADLEEKGFSVQSFIVTDQKLMTRFSAPMRAYYVEYEILRPGSERHKMLTDFQKKILKAHLKLCRKTREQVEYLDLEGPIAVAITLDDYEKLAAAAVRSHPRARALKQRIKQLEKNMDPNSLEDPAVQEHDELADIEALEMQRNMECVRKFIIDKLSEFTT